MRVGLMRPERRIRSARERHHFACTPSVKTTTDGADDPTMRGHVAFNVLGALGAFGLAMSAATQREWAGNGCVDLLGAGTRLLHRSTAPADE